MNEVNFLIMKIFLNEIEKYLQNDLFKKKTC